jgi:single-stranded-DNA-specific exonuclease
MGAETGRRWRIAAMEHDRSATLATALGVSPLLAHLLLQRGCATPEAARAFLEAPLSALHDPLRMTGMAEAVARLQQAISQHQPIWVCGDFDVDGVTGIALLVGGLTHAGADVTYAVPNRHEHGYGLPTAIVHQAADAGGRLLVTVDHGISSIESAILARQRGLDLIICDHHLPPPVLPPATAILNPRQPGCRYPFQDLCGVGIAFKLIQALYGPAAQEECWPLLDLVTLGTVADLVPLLGENRILVKHGLGYLAATTRPGILALAEVAGAKLSEPGWATPGRIGFGLAPRINAAGRLTDAGIAVRLLLTTDIAEARQIATELDKHNKDRQLLEIGILESALAETAATHDLARDRAIVAAAPDWHPGVLGIVASRLVERFNRPTALIAITGDTARGSVRTACGLHVADTLTRCGDLLTAHGGHRAAGGFSLPAAGIAAFRERFLAVAAETIADEALEPTLGIDAEASLDALDLSITDALAPHGLGNPAPVFATRQVQVMRFPRRVGKNHLKIRVRQTGGEKVIEAIGFNLGEYVDPLEAAIAPQVDLAYVPERNVWNGQESLQLRIRDLRPLPDPPRP